MLARRMFALNMWRGLSLVMLVSSLICDSEAQAPRTEGDDFEGAIWRFTLTGKGPRKAELNGMFRVNRHVMYQKESPDDKDFTKKVGKCDSQGKRCTLELNDFRAFDKEKRLHEGLKGKVAMSIDRFGEWTGTFIDDKGRNWDFHCSRVKE